MRGDEIQKLALKITLSLPETSLSQPFGVGCDVVKVMDKVFLLSTQYQQHALINLKCDPIYADELKVLYPSIRAAYHMNKKRWISVYEGENIDALLIEDLVKASYALVVSKLKKTERLRISILKSTY
ncbi:hypothetical protein G9F31_06925 [Acinetobacter sp. 187]|uniref:MmcQ/YjbR family DNA-binding protein n=1 Tax=Acinetobacter lanii TaxID=2715163 RepID=UPI001409953B|nr:MmcQ/YjbR family DNA-binding protein [Acinetobacter lanii]NHC03502.1 hypothetical protein [Acinetobacter lanii]